MRKLEDPFEAHGAQIVAHARVAILGNEHLYIPAKHAQGRPMKMVPMDVTQVDEVRLQRPHSGVVDGWVIPPRSPVGAADQPRVDYQCRTAVLDSQAGVGEYLKFHSAAGGRDEIELDCKGSSSPNVASF